MASDSFFKKVSTEFFSMLLTDVTDRPFSICRIANVGKGLPTYGGDRQDNRLPVGRQPLAATSLRGSA